jgi:hypothetical protein
MLAGSLVRSHTGTLSSSGRAESRELTKNQLRGRRFSPSSGSRCIGTSGLASLLNATLRSRAGCSSEMPHNGELPARSAAADRFDRL